MNVIDAMIIRNAYERHDRETLTWMRRVYPAPINLRKTARAVIDTYFNGGIK